MSGCKKLDQVNTNPNLPLSSPPAPQFLSSELLIGYAMGSDMSRFSAIWTQQAVGVNRQAQLYTTYTVGNADFDAPWGNLYQGMTNLNDMIITAQKAGNNYYVGVGKILMAYSLGASTDVWGDMPFSKAFQGVANLQPAFDNQQALYTTMHQLCDDGIAAFALPAGKLVPGADDIIYGGDVTKWTAFAHALKARFYLHTSKRNAGDLAKVQPELVLAGVATGATSNTFADAYITFGNANNTAGPWYQFMQQRAGDITFAQGNLGTVMINTSDPRLAAYIDTTQNVLGSFYGGTTSPAQLVTGAELYFIYAEVSLRNADKATAATASNNGALASVQAITGAAAPAGWTTSYASETAGTITLEKIINQKYLALFLNPECFADWRRTTFPTLVQAAGSSTTGIPHRFFYAETETERNSATPRGLQLTDHVWWDN